MTRAAVWLIDAFYVVAGLGIAFGLLLLVLGRNPLPAGPKPIRSALAIWLQALSVIVAGLLLVAATAAFDESRGHHVADPRFSIVSLIAFPLMAGLWMLARSVDRRARGPTSRA